MDKKNEKKINRMKATNEKELKEKTWKIDQRKKGRNKIIQEKKNCQQHLRSFFMKIIFDLKELYPLRDVTLVRMLKTYICTDKNCYDSHYSTGYNKKKKNKKI